MGGAATQSPVLRVIVENLFYPVTLDVLHQVQTTLLALSLARDKIVVRIFNHCSWYLHNIFLNC